MTRRHRASISDVIVVGGGAAGLAAAISAAGMGRSVVLLEKNPDVGGMMSWSVGSVTATNTPHQQRAGIRDSPQEHYEDLALHAGPLAFRDNLALRRILVDNTNEIFDWLTALGIVFVGPTPDPPHRYPRMHNVVPNSRSFAYNFKRECRALGIDICLNMKAERLLQKSGRVTGVEAHSQEGTRHRFSARGAVVLATGDYSAASDIKARFASAAVADLDAVVSTATGDGHRMAFEAGGIMLNGDIVRGPIMRFIPPARAKLLQKLPPLRPITQGIVWAMDHLPPWILRPFLMSFLTTALGPSPGLFKEGAVLINRKGERFTDELANPAYDVAKQPERIAYIVFDQVLAAKFSAWPHFVSTAPGVAYAYLADYRLNRSDIFRESNTIEGLAISMGISAKNLRSTLENYNTALPDGRPPLQKAPFFALGPLKSYVVFTDGGLKVSPRLEVLRENSSVIPGLYAAGAVGQGGLLLEGHGHHLGWGFISGRIAGRNAAFEVQGAPLKA